MSQTDTSGERPPTNSTLPSGEKASAVAPSFGPVNSATDLPSSTRDSRTTPDLLADAKSVPSGETATAVIDSL
jgi:hypothetical protein